MRIVVTGQVGLDKRPFLEQVVEIVAAAGREISLCNIGDMMYAEAPDVARGRILDLPLSRLNSLRRSVFRDVLATAERSSNILVNTHATFRWRHGLFCAFDLDHMTALDADLYLVVVDHVDRVHYRLTRDGYTDQTLKDLLVWREEEILATELLAQVVRQDARFYICPKGADDTAVSNLARLILHPDHKKIYLSFPLSCIGPGSPGEVVAQVEAFRREMKRYFVCFDPADVQEQHLCGLALKAIEAGRRTVEFGPPGEQASLAARQLLDVVPDIEGQVYARDFKLIEQADTIVCMMPEPHEGAAACHEEVRHEIQHAREAGKEVYVIWASASDPPPELSQGAARIFRTADEAVAFLLENGYAPPSPAGSLFG